MRKTRLPPLEHPVGRNIRVMAELEQKSLDDRTRLGRLTDGVARVAGSTPFIVLHAIGFTAWVAWNSTRVPFDPFPYSLLNLVVALEAVLLTSVVLMTQNHMTRLADRRAHLDLQVNMLAEQELTAMLQMLQALCTKAGVQVDMRDGSVEQLLTETDVRKIAIALDRGLDALPAKPDAPHAPSGPLTPAGD